MSTRDYGTAQAQVRRRLGIAKGGAGLLAQWSSFVDECEACYSWDISEYNNEIRVRDELAAILEAQGLSQFAEHQELATRVEDVDVRFRCLLRDDFSVPNARSWWRAGVLRRAGAEYCRYFRDAHDVDLEMCEP